MHSTVQRTLTKVDTRNYLSDKYYTTIEQLLTVILNTCTINIKRKTKKNFSHFAQCAHTWHQHDVIIHYKFTLLLNAEITPNTPWKGTVSMQQCYFSDDVDHPDFWPMSAHSWVRQCGLNRVMTQQTPSMSWEGAVHGRTPALVKQVLARLHVHKIAAFSFSQSGTGAPAQGLEPQRTGSRVMSNQYHPRKLLEFRMVNSDTIRRRFVGAF